MEERKSPYNRQQAEDSKEIPVQLTHDNKEIPVQQTYGNNEIPE